MPAAPTLRRSGEATGLRRRRASWGASLALALVLALLVAGAALAQPGKSAKSKPAPPRAGNAAASSQPTSAPRAAATPSSAAPAPPDYPLDKLSRRVPAGGRLACPAVERVKYRGDVIRYRHLAVVYVGFRERLRQLEQIASEVAVQHYGRAPSHMLQTGTYLCRRMRRHPTWLSEHALGNAIDVAGFDFRPLPRGAAAPAGLPRALRGHFQVRVKRHWLAKRGAGAVHARFLRALIARLRARPDVFRVMLGPHYPGHYDHFHFDAAPWRVVDGFERPPPAKPKP